MTDQLVCVTNSGNWSHLTEAPGRTLCGRAVVGIVSDARGVSCYRCLKRLRRVTAERIERAERGAYTLVAVADNADGLDGSALTKALGGAVIQYSVTGTTIGRDSLPATEYRYTLDATMIRNTDAHSLACNRGFIAHCE